VYSNLENKKISPLKLLKKLSSHLHAEKKRKLLSVFILSIFSSIAESISIVMLIPFISFFINPDSYLFNSFFQLFFDFFNITSQKDTLTIVSFSFIFIIFLSSYIKLKYIKNSNTLTDSVTSDFRIKIFNFLINQDFSYHYKYGSNEIMSSLALKSGALSAVVFASLNIVNSFLILLAVAITLIINEPFYTSIIIFSVILFFFIVFKSKSQNVLKKGQNINSSQNFLIDIFENAVGYLPEIILYNLKNFFSSILSKTSEDIAKYSSEIRTTAQTPRVYLELFVLVFIVLFILFSNFNERSLETNLSYLAILAFGAQKSLPLINNIYNMSINFKGSTPIVLNFLNILEISNNKIENNIVYEQIKFEKSITIKNMSFKYNKNQSSILNNINLRINKGEKISIKGQTGSGKSTLANIISGLLDPSTGEVLVDDISIDKNNKKNWQKNISIVPQTIFLNDATILENIAIGVNIAQIDLEKVKLASKSAQISEFIESLPNKYNEKVGERGVRLSGGQRQRVGIARALYRDANVIILDEPTNALDSETEKLLMKSLKSISKNITIIMISHSNTFLNYFDQIIDLDKYN